MIRRLLSQYHPRYLRSLVYMLQASEYTIHDFWAWYSRVRDFRYVERRKQLVMTNKAAFLLAALWVMTLILGVAVLASLFVLTTSYRYLVAAGIVVVAPYIIVGWGICILLCVRFFIQKPIAFFIIKDAHKSLAGHAGLRIGVAGSFGKTSMREILRVVLSESKKVAAPPESYNTPLGISRFIRSLNGDEEVLVFELGEYYPGDVRKLCELVHPDIGIVTGINEAHLEKFKTLDHTVDTIYEIADFVDGESLYVNGENTLALSGTDVENIIYSREGIDGWNIAGIQTDLSGTSFILQNEDMALTLKSQLLGAHQVGPLAAAAHLALTLGVTPSQVQEGISKTRPFKHRLEPKEDATGVVVLDDSYNGNPDGVSAVIDFLASLKDCRRFYVTPGLVEMGERVKEVHIDIGKKLAEAQIEKVILIKTSVTPYIAEGLKQNKFEGDLTWFDSAPEAYDALPHLTVKGDVVLLQNDWPDQYQ